MNISLNELYCKILVKNKGNDVIDVRGEKCYCCGGQRQHVLCKLVDTPHYKFLEGDKAFYKTYLEKGGRQVGYGLEHSVENFERLIADFNIERIKRFPCHRVNDKYILQDGVHRCCIILYNRLLEEVPIHAKRR